MKPKHETQVAEALNFEDMENEDQTQMSSEASDNNH